MPANERRLRRRPCVKIRFCEVQRCNGLLYCHLRRDSGVGLEAVERLTERAQGGRRRFFFLGWSPNGNLAFFACSCTRAASQEKCQTPRASASLSLAALWPGLLARRVTPDAPPPCLYPHSHGRAHAGQRTWTLQRFNASTLRRLTASASAPTPTAWYSPLLPPSPQVRSTPRELCVAFDGLAGSAACRRTRAPNLLLLLLLLAVRRRRFLRIVHRSLTAAVRTSVVTAFALRHADGLRGASRFRYFGRTFACTGGSVCSPPGPHHLELVVSSSIDCRHRLTLRWPTECRQPS